MADKVPAQDVLAARGVAGFTGSVIAGAWATENAAVVDPVIEEISAAGAPTDGTDEVQTITVTATSGTFAVNFDGASTAQLARDITSANLQVALRALPTINGAHVNVAGDAPHTITFVGNLGKLNVPLLTTDVHALVNGGGAGTAVVAVSTPGVTATGRNKAPGCHYTNLTTGDEYVNTGTGLAPTWTAIGAAIAAEITTLAGKIPEAAEADLGALTAATVAGTVEAGGVGAAAGGWDTAGHRDTTITTIGEMKTTLNAAVVDLGLMRTKVNNLLAKLRDAGIITP